MSSRPSASRLFFRRTWRERALFTEALLLTCWARLLVYGMAFRRLAPRLGQSRHETPPTLSPTERALAVEVSWAVQAASRHAPLRLVCLPQAIAAKWMLRRRGVPTTLYLGVAPDAAKPGEIIAHAWLRAGNKIVTGEEEMRRHQPLAAFGDLLPRG